MNDDRITRALSANADAIELRPGDPASVMRRGSARRNRRRAAVGGLAAVAVAATSFSVATREPSSEVESTDTASARVVDSPFDWTVVTPQTALGFSRSTVVVGDAVYSLSTAPGEDLPEDERYAPALYRSQDGAEWTQLALPEGLAPSSLAASGDTLYAIGTAPAGGDSRSVLVSSSSDGAATWNDVMTLPGDLADLEARFPDQIFLNPPVVAALDSSHIVAAVTVSAQPDVEALLPGVADPSVGWETTSEGVTVYEAVPCENEADCARTTVTTAPVALDAAAAADPASVANPVLAKPGSTYTWDELGVDPELVGLMDGRTYVYATQDGAAFERADLPVELSGWAPVLTAEEDGYTLFAPDPDGVTMVLSSPDGVAWTATSTLPGTATAAGVLAGRPAVATYDVDGWMTVQVEQAAGTWSQVDLAGAIDGYTLGDVVFGPLGVAAVGWAENGEDPLLLHSGDGATVSIVSLVDYVDATGLVDLDVSADAITVRFGRPVDRDGKPVGPQQVLVGAPR